MPSRVVRALRSLVGCSLLSAAMRKDTTSRGAMMPRVVTAKPMQASHTVSGAEQDQRGTPPGAVRGTRLTESARQTLASDISLFTSPP